MGQLRVAVTLLCLIALSYFTGIDIVKLALALLLVRLYWIREELYKRYKRRS